MQAVCVFLSISKSEGDQIFRPTPLGSSSSSLLRVSCLDNTHISPHGPHMRDVSHQGSTAADKRADSRAYCGGPSPSGAVG